LFSRGRGIVNADFHYFWSIDQFFHGVPAPPETLVFRCTLDRPVVDFAEAADHGLGRLGVERLGIEQRAIQVEDHVPRRPHGHR
jgi:hypothetical protein